MAVTVADVVQALLAIAPEKIPARIWLAGLLPELGTESPPAPTAPPIDPAPFESLADHRAALAMLRAGKHGRDIAAEFDIPLMAAALWAQRNRAGGGHLMRRFHDILRRRLVAWLMPAIEEHHQRELAAHAPEAARRAAKTLATELEGLRSALPPRRAA